MKIDLRYCFGLFFMMVLALLETGSIFGADTLQFWPVDIHEKIFKDSMPKTSGAVVLSAAGNEYESGQIGIRSEQDIKDITWSLSPLIQKDGKNQIAVENIRLRSIGMIPIKKNTPNADTIVIRKAPCEIPDILWEKTTVSLVQKEAQGLWITVFVPKGTDPGLYQGIITLTSKTMKVEIPLQVKVFPFTLPEKRNLMVTNWWFPDKIAAQHKVKVWSEEHWRLIDAYLRNMKEHRQNVLMINWVPSAKGPVTAKRMTDGTWQIDWSHIERLMTMAEKNGVLDRVELTHIGGVDRNTHQINIRNLDIYDEKEGKIVSLPAKEWMKPVFQELQNYLEKTKRIDKSMIHVADEPYGEDIISWRVASSQLHKVAPKLKRIDAIESIDFCEELEVWVPKLTHFDRWRDAFEARRSNGEFWYYICCHPIGIHYPNRFMDLPASRIRVLHWINYTEKLKGYLHWGLNFWIDDPFGPPTLQYGPGDTHTIYPGTNGPLDSIRWEIERESIEDFEYMTLLENLTTQVKTQFSGRLWWLDPDRRAMEIGRRVVPDITHTEMNATKIAEARNELVEAIEAISSEPRLIVQTFPKDNSTIYEGPSFIELYGLTTPGAKVTINKVDVSVEENGTFRHSTYGKMGAFDVEIVATKGDKQTKTIRHFIKK